MGDDRETEQNRSVKIPSVFLGIRVSSIVCAGGRDDGAVRADIQPGVLRPSVRPSVRPSGSVRVRRYGFEVNGVFIVKSMTRTRTRRKGGGWKWNKEG